MDSNDDDMPSEPWLKSKFQIIKNQIVIGLAWIFQFTAYQSIANLQSSLNSSEGLGTASLSTIYVALVLSSLFLPPIMIKKLGLKWTIVLSQATYTLFIASNIYPGWYTSIPTAVILGLGAAPLWTAKCTFLSETAGYYARLSMENTEAVVNRFFGIFFMMFQTSQIWGNVISSTVLKPNIDANHTIVQNISLCGSSDCPGGASSQITKPKLSTVYLLCGLYVAAAIFAMFIIIAFLNSYKRKNSNKNGQETSLSLLVATLKHMKNPYQLLLIPMTFWLGFQQAFLGADYTKSYVACSKGINHVGLTMICYGITDALCSVAFGQLMKYTGRIPIILFGALLHYSLLIVLLLWHPNPDQLYVLYLLPVCYGVCDAVWQTQINAIYGVIFKGQEEAAFSNFRLWESLGFAISYAYSNFICVSIKLYLLLGYLTLSMIGYVLVEILSRRKLTKELLVNQN